MSPNTPAQDAEEAIAAPSGAAAVHTAIDSPERPGPPAWFDWVALGGMVVVWGSAFAGVTIVAKEFSPTWVMFLRLLAATSFLAVVQAVQHEKMPRVRPPTHPAWFVHIVTGILGLGLPFYLFTLAAQTLPSGLLAMCNGATPVMTAVLAHFFIVGERATPQRVFGVALAACGFVALIAPRIQAGATLEATALLIAIGASCCYSVAHMFNARAPRTTAVSGALMMCLWGLVAACLPILIVGWGDQTPSLKTWLVVLLLGALSSGFGTLIYVFLMQRRGPIFTSMSTYLIPLWATGLGVLAMHERPQWNAYLALVLILLGIFVTTRRRARPAPGPNLVAERPRSA